MKLTPKPFVFALCLVPLGLIAYQAFTGDLGANPASALEKRLGLWGFRFLLLTLTVTPLRRLAHWNYVARYRRMLGLFAFFYVLLHFLTWAVLDHSLDPAEMLHDILKHPFIAVGIAAFLILIALASTSTKAAIKRLGKNWQRLHRFVYLAIALAALHYIMLVKSWPAQPLIYAALVAILLGIRVVFTVQKRTRRKPAAA